MKHVFLLALAVMASCVFGQSKTDAGTIYGPKIDNPFADRIARNKGDIVMIVINEQSAASFAAATKSVKGDSNSVSVDVFKGLLGRLFGPMSTGGKSQVQGQGDTSQTSRMSARMSAMVKEVLPNGTMVIEGSRALVTNKETQTFVLSGIIRVADIAPDNTIDSTKVAEAEIKMQGTGMISDRQRKGILTQLLDWLF